MDSNAFQEKLQGYASRIAFALGLLFLVVSGLNAQESKIVFEEIRSIPENKIGDWKIGDQTFVVDQRTQVIDRYPLEKGYIAVVEYFEIGGKLRPLFIQSFPFKAEEINDGPYVFWKDESTAEVITITAGKVARKTIENITERQFEKGLSALETSVMLDPQIPQAPKSEWEAPNKLMAISDLEGHYENVIEFLKTHQVIDENRSWIWGDGHLALVGDLIDRGEQVTELMVFLRRLEHEAELAGGQIHYVLGNHEVMVMGGDIRYIHPKYHFIAQRVGMGYHELFGTQSDIGRWWRSKNVVTKVGNLLFIHAGYSPELDKAQHTPDELNALVRKGLPPEIPQGITAGENPIGSQNGPLWYRGYFDRHAGQWPKPTDAEMDALIERHGVDHVVIGHTVVEQAGPLADTNHVIAIDVKWQSSELCQGLLQQDGKLWRLKMDGTKELMKAK